MKILSVYKFASKLVWLGRIEAKNEAKAIEKASREFKVAANRLIATVAISGICSFDCQRP
jgi:hypothetical protein